MILQCAKVQNISQSQVLTEQEFAENCQNLIFFCRNAKKVL